jgi:hypothetical protein
MMREIEEMSSDDDAASDGADDDAGAQSANVRRKRAAGADLRGKGGKKVSGRAVGGSTFASADDFGAEVDEWHSQLVKVRAALCRVLFDRRLYSLQILNG